MSDKKLFDLLKYVADHPGAEGKTLVEKFGFDVCMEAVEAGYIERTDGKGPFDEEDKPTVH